MRTHDINICTYYMYVSAIVNKKGRAALIVVVVFWSTAKCNMQNLLLGFITIFFLPHTHTHTCMHTYIKESTPVNSHAYF